MTNNELMIFLRKTLLDSLTARGKDYAVEQNYQPHQLGTNRQPTVYFHHVNDVMRGWAEQRQEWDAATQTMTTVETQLIETRIQIAATVDAPVNDPNATTVIDVIRMARWCIQSQSFIVAANAAGLGIYRVSDLQSVDVLSDSPGYEKRPTFDIIIQHSDTIRTIAGSTDRVVDKDGESTITPPGSKSGVYRI